MSSQALVFPTSFAQERLWFLEHLEPGSSVYHVSAAIRFTGPLNPQVMERCFNMIVARHEVLRTRFASHNGNSVQVILPHCMVPFPITDLTFIPAKQREAEVARLFKEQAHTPFQLEQAPLLRLRLLRFSTQEHILLLTMHHIISDGWSIGVLVREFSLLYQAFSEGRLSPLPDTTLQYADFAQWQREWLQGEVLEEQIAFWKKMLAGSPPFLNLPTDHPRPAVPTRRGASRRFQISDSLFHRLNQLGKEEGCTLFMTLLAAFKVLLHRYTGDEDIVLGSPVANRNRVEIEPLIGFFVNTVVLRTDLSGDPSFKELLERVRHVTLSAFEHQDLPFEVLVEALSPERDLSRTPLFQIMFVLQNTPGAELVLPGVEMEFLAFDPDTAKFDLTMLWENDDKALNGIVEYNCDIFEPATISRLITHLMTLLEAIAARPEARVSELHYLPSEERNAFLPIKTLQETFRHEAAVHRRFEAQAKQSPEAIALVSGEQRLTYAELNQRANRLAHLLKRHGVGPEVLVGICLERSVEMVVGILAILKAGGAYLPIDPDYPRERLAYLMQDSGAPLLITQETLLSAHEFEGVTLLFLDLLDEEISGLSQENLACECAPDQLAYVIYTSGSTGNPKGVAVEHGNLSRLFSATDSWYRFGADDAWTLFHSFAFDFSVWELWGALIYGGKLVLVPYLVSRSPGDFYDLLVREGVTVLNQTPSAFRLLMKEDESRQAVETLALRYVIFGGEALDLASLRPWFDRHGDRKPQLINMYGITETTVHVTYRPLTAFDLSRGSVIGEPIPDLALYLLDRYRQPVPVGVIGELYVGGAGVSRGYLKRPELTAERFVENPFTGQGRLYRTGDLARRLPDGEMEYIGRADHQVKIRGFRIEPGEIEAVLTGHPAVREAVVLPWKDQAGKRLVAYMVADGAQDALLVELRRFLKAKLPVYMVPAQLVLLESFPLNQNGKVDRKALPRPGKPQGTSAGYLPPRTPAEELLAGIWRDVLELERVGVGDNFFDIGGDSIRSIQVLARARKAGLPFSLSQLFRHQSIDELARVLTPGQIGSVRRATAPFALIEDADRQKLPEEVVDAYPLSALQQGMLFYSELNSEYAVYHDIFSYHLRAPWDHEALRISLASLVERHALLRTGFVFVGYKEPLQLVHRFIEVPLGVTDLREFDSARQEQMIADWVAEEKKRRFRIGEAPLLRLQVHLRSNESFNFIMSFHHAILDGWSVASLLTELFRDYLSRSGGEAAPALPLPETRFSDFIALEREALADPESQRYWRERVAGVTAHPLPRWPMPLLPDAPLGVHDVPLDEKLCRKLEHLARHAGVPLKTVFLAAHMHVLTALCDSDQVTTGLVANGRPEELGAELVAGLFLNTLPFTLSLSGGRWTDLARQIFAEEQSILPHRRYPLSEIQRFSGGAPLFDTAFNFTNFHVYREVLGLKGVEVLGGDFFERTNFTLVANFSNDPDTAHLNLKLVFDINSLHPEQVEAWGRYYLETLTAMASDPEGFYQEHSVLPEAERLLQLKRWNNTAVSYPSGRMMHQFFEDQASSFPDRIALRFEGQSLSYGELNRRANRLARYLRHHDIGPEAVVAVSLVRSPLLLVSLLAVLKAGGAYLPLDPDYPEERRCYLIEDSHARIVISLSKHSGIGPEVQQLNPELAQKAIDQESAENLKPITKPDQAAYLIYTSGSTGRPKGVVNLHRAISNRLIWMQDTFRLTHEDVVLQKTPFSFDVSVWEFFWPLMYGARLVMARPGGHQDREYLIDLITAERVTTLHFVPSMLKIFLEDSRSGSCHSLRRVICSGEELSADLQERFFARLEAELHNLYGPTEAAVDVTCWHCLRDPAATCVPIGRPIANVSAFILDRRLRPAPVGVPGELHLGGVALARGYLNQPELTAEKFFPNPFGKRGERLYKTGDLARYRPDGVIEYLGRLDSQVKLRGFRIELGEIESVLAAHPEVAQAVLLLRQEQGDPRLVAYLTAAGDTDPSVEDLRTYLRRSLPEYMIPSTFVVLDVFPLNQNGKLDRKALPAPKGERQTSRPYIPPRNDLEQGLARIWCQVLSLDRIGIDDDFFQSGGHSLLVTQVISRMRDELNLELPLRSLFEAPTIANYAVLVQQVRAEQSTTVKAVPLIPVSRDRYRAKLSDKGEIAISSELRAKVRSLHSKTEWRA